MKARKAFHSFECIEPPRYLFIRSALIGTGAFLYHFPIHRIFPWYQVHQMFLYCLDTFLGLVG